MYFQIVHISLHPTLIVFVFDCRSLWATVAALLASFVELLAFFLCCLFLVLSVSLSVYRLLMTYEFSQDGSSGSQDSRCLHICAIIAFKTEYWIWPLPCNSGK